MENKTEKIGNTLILIKEIVAIGDVYMKSSEMLVFPIYISGGTKIEVFITANSPEERPDPEWNSINPEFTARALREHQRFVRLWEQEVMYKK